MEYCPCKPETGLSVPSGQGNIFCNAQSCNNQVFDAPTIQPRNATTCSENVPLNSMGIRLDGRYKRVKHNIPGCHTGFVTFDNPLSYCPVRAVRTVFDRPNYTGQVNVGNVCKDEIYDPMYSDYGKNYRNYMDINAGQIQYHIDKWRLDAYAEPNFSTPAKVTSKLFVDPNGIVKPEYERVPLNKYNWNKYQNGSYDACDSFTHDTMEFRQDIMARQQRKNNQSDWVMRWGPQVLRGEF